MDVPHVPLGTSTRGDDHIDLSSTSLAQIAACLDALQTECAQLGAYLQNARQRLVQQETQIDQHLARMAALAEQFRSHIPADSATALNPAVHDPTPAPHPATDAPPALCVRTFAQFQASWADRPISLCRSKKGSAIFRYLFICPDRCATRETLLALFWPDEPADKANHKLHIAISALRQALSEAIEVNQVLIFDEDRYFLNPSIHIWTDADEFVNCLHAGQQLEQQGRMPEAVVLYEAGCSLYRGDFMAEDMYADWAAAPRARLEEMYLTLLGRLAAYYFDQERFEPSIACCRQIVSKDSFREDAYRQLMQCYSRMGQRNQALREFHLCAENLQRELGVSPMRETIALYERIARQEFV